MPRTTPPSLEHVIVARRDRKGAISHGTARPTRIRTDLMTLGLEPGTSDEDAPTLGCNTVFSGGNPLARGLSYQGGALASGAAIQLIFWGSVWNSPGIAVTPGAIVAAMQTLVDSSYFFALKQYNVDPGPLGRALVVTAPDPPSTIGTDDVTGLLWDLVGSVFPQTDQPGGHNIYVFFLPPGAHGLPDTAGGAHSDTTHLVFDPLPKIHRAWYAWIGFTGSPAGIMTSVSHEVVEAYTNPEPNNGWIVPGPDEGDTEIADLCNGLEGTVEGVAVVSYFSKFNNACIIPRGRSVRLFLAARGIDGAAGLRRHIPPGICLRAFLAT